MKRDIIGDIFLGGVLLSLLFLFSFPVYFSYAGVHARPVELTERLMSVCFIMAWILTIIWACWKKKVWVIAGAAVFGILAFVPKWCLPMVDEHIAKEGSDFLWSTMSSILNRIYELVHAPFAGSVWLLGEKTAMNMPEKLLPVCVIAYVATNIFRYYKNAFVTERKQMKDFAHFRKSTEARKAAQSASAGSVREAPMPLGTVVMNENAQVEKAVYTGRENALVDGATMEATAIAGSEDATKRLSDAGNEEATRRISENTDEDATRRIPDNAEGEPTRRIETETPAEETKVIELAAHAPSSRNPEEAAEETPAAEENTDTEKTQVIQLAAHAPTSHVDGVEENAEADSGYDKEETGEEPKTGGELDFPDVRGEAEVIDVFGDNDLD